VVPRERPVRVPHLCRGPRARHGVPRREPARAAGPEPEARADLRRARPDLSLARGQAVLALPSGLPGAARARGLRRRRDGAALAAPASVLDDPGGARGRDLGGGAAERPRARGGQRGGGDVALAAATDRRAPVGHHGGARPADPPAGAAVAARGAPATL